MGAVIAGDIGGTKTRLAIIEVVGTQVRPRDGEAEPSGAGVAASHLLPQTAGFAITSDLASVVGSPGRMAGSFTSNVSKAGMPALQENIEALRERIAAPLLGVIPYQTQPDAKVAATYLQLGLLDKQKGHD